MQDPAYLTTEEAATYLRLKERKVYELAAAGRIPCAKVTGRWLFPRAALDRWIDAGLARPEGFAAAAPPPIVGGSTDPLLEWAVRQSGAGLATLPEGSGAGLDRLARDEIAIAAIHLHREDGAEANITGVRAWPGLHDVVVIGFTRREQGLVTALGNPLGLASPGEAVRRAARPVLRQPGAGAQLLLGRLLAAEGVALRDAAPAARAATGQDLALTIRAGGADWGIATRAVAETHGLGFVPLLWEHFDLVLRRRTYFEPAAQALFYLIGTPEFSARADALGGYEVAEAGRPRFNA